MLLHHSRLTPASPPVTFNFTNLQSHWRLRLHRHHQDLALTGKSDGMLIRMRFFRDSGTKTLLSLHRPHLSLHQSKISSIQMVILTRMLSNDITRTSERCWSTLSP